MPLQNYLADFFSSPEIDSHSTAKSGFDAILEEMGRSLSKPLSLAAWSDTIFTIGQRQPWKFGFASLSSKEKALYHALKNKTVNPAAGNADGGTPKRMVVGIAPYGRPVISASVAPNTIIPLGEITLGEDEASLIERIGAEYDAKAAEDARDAIYFFERHDPYELTHTVTYGIDHIDPILIYTNESLFTNFSSFNKLLGKNSVGHKGFLLDDLVEGRPRELSLDEKVFLYCFYVLKLGGFRGEEFNGQQLTCSTLDIYLAKKIAELSECLKTSALTPSTLEEKAQLCAELKKRLRKTHFVYRKVNGLCFYKSEHYNERHALNLGTFALPSSIKEVIGAAYGISHADFADIDGYFRQVVSSVVPFYKPVRDIGLNSLEQILALIVRSAVSELVSDIGMTRGFRDMCKWQRAVEAGDFEAVCAFPSTDYFCAVFASDETKKHLTAKEGMYCRVMTAIAHRMTFNSWHYMPGHFYPEFQSEPRHYYFPPRMADITTWSDQHHAGHVLAHVRNAIRSPAWLTFRGRKYYGMIDLRLMRRSGAGYTEAELMRAKEYTAYLRAVYQAISDLCFETGAELKIDAFGKDWYSKNHA